MAKQKVVVEDREESGNRRKKTECPISLAEFRAKALRGLNVVINGVPFQAPIKEFSTRSFGWYLNAKMVIDVDGTPCDVQIGLNLTIVGSKEAARD